MRHNAEHPASEKLNVLWSILQVLVFSVGTTTGARGFRLAKFASVTR